MGFFSPQKNNRELSASVIFQPLLIPSVITHSFQKKKQAHDPNCSKLTTFFHLGLELWVPGQCLLLMLIIEFFPDGTLKVFPAPAAWKTLHSPISNSKWKDKWRNVPAGSAWFPAKNVWVLFVFGSAMLLRNRGCFFSGIAARLGLWRENSRYQTEVQAASGLLSRLHVLAGIGLRRAVETRAWWKREEACNATMAISVSRHLISIQTTEQTHGTMEQSESVLNNAHCRLTVCGLAAFIDEDLTIHIATLKKLLWLLPSKSKHEATSESMGFSEKILKF